LRDNNLASITYPSNRFANYTYDIAGRPTGLSRAPAGKTATSYASLMTYAPHGALSQF
jgi:YD repeat-containing protein